MLVGFAAGADWSAALLTWRALELVVEEEDSDSRLPSLVAFDAAEPFDFVVFAVELCCGCPSEADFEGLVLVPVGDGVEDELGDGVAAGAGVTG